MTYLTHLFLPQESNNFRARILHSSSLISLLLFVLLLKSFLTFFSVVDLSVLGYAANISPKAVIDLTNQKREEANLPPLVENELLDQAALMKGRDMLEKDYWAHVSPEGTEPWSFFLDGGYKYRFAGENLARDFSNPKDAVNAWIASPSHKENLMSPKYKEIGIAVVEGDLAGADTTIIVQLFGTRSTDTTPVVPVAAAKNETMINPEAFVAGQREVTFASPSPKVVISPFRVSKTVSLVLVMVLISVLALDSFIVWRRGIFRISGRSFAHISFMGMILAVLIIIRAGKIL